jgi:hypothetical protein
MSILTSYFYYEDQQLARREMQFFERKLREVDNHNCDDVNKELRRKRFQIVIDALKYTWSL